jgi:phosphopantothenoylcysteine decarboxylase/phosphopantothenate--cysteine ligase
MSHLQSKILLIVTGSIACYKAADLTSKLRQLGFQIRVVLSNSASQFISPITFEALSGEKVYTSLWEKDESLAHIDLVRWSDLVLVAPATADFIAHLASGRANDLPLALSIAHDFKKPFLIAPAMNPAMYQHPATQANLKKLEGWGYSILPSPKGLMACQETGNGRMLETPELIESIHYFLSPKKYKPQNVLVTSGGTAVRIDSVRYVTNFSTGRSGFQLTKSLLRAGHAVTLIRSKNSSQFDSSLLFYQLMGSLKIIEFETPDDLERILNSVASSNQPDALIQIAAISDFDIVNPSMEKIDSSNRVSIELTPRIKTIQTFYKNFPKVPIMAFKLTTKETEETKVKMKISALFKTPSVVKVIHNTLESVRSSKPSYNIWDSNLNLVTKCTGTEELGQWLIEDLGRIKV